LLQKAKKAQKKTKESITKNKIQLEGTAFSVGKKTPPQALRNATFL
jgi:hypothetical protein